MNLVVTHNLKTGKVECVLADLDADKALNAYNAEILKPVADATLVQWFRRPAMPMKRRVVQPTAPVAEDTEEELAAREASEMARLAALQAQSEAPAPGEDPEDDLGLTPVAPAVAVVEKPVKPAATPLGRRK